MVTLFEKGYSKQDILKRVGNIHQLAGAQLFEYKTGRAKGATGIRIRNGLGLDLTLLPDKGLDIFDLYYQGTPLAWISKNEVVNSHHFDSSGLGWLKSFAGGMMVTCGLRNVGPPADEDGEHFGLHGTYTSLPSENLNINEYWKDDHFHIDVSGRIEESRIFGGKLVNYRTISLSSRNNKISVRDRIVNEGFQAEPLMILYHFNWGSPLFSSASLLKIDPERTEVRDKNAEADSWKAFMEPKASFEEQVYLHRLNPDREKNVGYELFNPELNLGVRVEWDRAPLPCFTQWLMCGEGEYVLGLEPGNCFPTGRVNERKNNRLELLPANSEKEISVSVEIIDRKQTSNQAHR